jgi:TP901-1 family phage major tail protein
MAKTAGRKVNLYKGTSTSAVLVAGGREHGLSINNEAIDVTDKDSNGWRTLMADPSLRSVDISFTGLMDGSTYIALALNSSTSALLDDYELRIDGVGTIAGDFHLSTTELGTPHDDAVELTMSLMSSGAITFTAAP